MAENSGRARSEKMARAVSIAALRDLAARRLPHALFDFIDGGATDEITMRHNETDFGKWMLVPRYAADVSRRNLSTDMLGSARAHSKQPRISSSFTMIPLWIPTTGPCLTGWLFAGIEGWPLV